MKCYLGDEEMAMLRNLREMARLYAGGDNTSVPSGRYSDNEVAVWEMFLAAYRAR